MEALQMSDRLPETTRKALRKAKVSVRYRLAVASRVLAAVLGGYLLAALASVCVSYFAPLPRPQAVVLGMTLSFLVYLAAVIWCFACRSAWHAWLGLAMPSAVLATAYCYARWLL